MDSSNLATVFGPNVLRRGKTGKFQTDTFDEIAQIADIVSVVKDLIDFHAAVFRVRPIILTVLSLSSSLSLHRHFTVCSTTSSRSRPNTL